MGEHATVEDEMLALAMGIDRKAASPFQKHVLASLLDWRDRLLSRRAGLSPIARTEIEATAEAMRRVVNQQMVVTPWDTQNLSDETRKVGKMLCYQINKWRAALDSVLGAESTKEMK